MSYDRINPDGSITRMPGTYHVAKARATIAKTYEINDKIREERRKQTQEGIAERSEKIAHFFKKLNDNKTAKIEDYL